MDSANILVLDTTPAPSMADELCGMLGGSMKGSANIHRHALAGRVGDAFRACLSRVRADLAMIVIESGDAPGLLNMLEDPRANSHAPLPALVAVLERSAPQETAALLRAGVADYILPPLHPGNIIPRVQRLLPLRPPSATAVGDGRQRLIGGSRAFVAEIDKLPLIARCDTGVLIEGETGTGKELFARAIHEHSPRRAKPFVCVNCGAIPVDLAESELFGHARGAFTGAYAAHDGLIAQADGGTLFLDEVASLPLLTQVKLLRFLQEREYRPLGATAARHADVRVIAAANTGLASAVHDGRFRNDLFYRLNIIRVSLPALRHRREDIPVLAGHFLQRHATRFASPARDLSPDARERLIRHEWPGNVRELEHTIERAVVFARGPVVDADHLFPDEPEEPVTDAESFKRAKARTVAEFERSYIEGLLAAHRGNISHAARRAGKNRRAFWELMRKHGVDVDRFRPLPAEPE